jgi:methylmalonyl-CoA mutase N-terminal domain/subunit
MSQKLITRFFNQAESCQKKLDKFTEDFAKDPAYALSWATDTFATAAKLRVLKQILAALDGNGCTVDDIRSIMMDRVLSKSMYPAQSTSPTSNLIEQYELAACADILSALKYVE